MAVNVQKFIAAGLDRVQYGILDSAGYFIGTVTTLAAGEDGGMGRLRGAQNTSPQFGEPQLLQVEGDDEALALFQFAPNELPVFDVEVATFDMVFRAIAEGTTVVDDGDASILAVQPEAPTYPNTMYLLTQRNKQQDTGLAGYSHLLIMKGLAAPTDTSTIQSGPNHSPDRYRVTGDRTTTTPWGQTLTALGLGTTSAAALRITTENRMSFHAFTGDNSTTTVTLDNSVSEASSDKVRVWVDATLQTYTTHYTVSGAVVTFGTAPGSGAKVVIRYEHA